MSSNDSPKTPFEDILAAATFGTDGGPFMNKSERLISKPGVFTLAVVWESPQVHRSVLTSVMHTFQDEIHLEHVFHGVNEKLPYRLRSMVAYSSSHYFAFVMSEEIHEWLLLDDTVISLVGQWADVVEMVINKGLQPSLLFYEYQR